MVMGDRYFLLVFVLHLYGFGECGWGDLYFLCIWKILHAVLLLADMHNELSK